MYNQETGGLSQLKIKQNLALPRAVVMRDRCCRRWRRWTVTAAEGWTSGSSTPGSHRCARPVDTPPCVCACTAVRYTRHIQHTLQEGVCVHDMYMTCVLTWKCQDVESVITKNFSVMEKAIIEIKPWDETADVTKFLVDFKTPFVC